MLTSPDTHMHKLAHSRSPSPKYSDTRTHVQFRSVHDKHVQCGTFHVKHTNTHTVLDSCIFHRLAGALNIMSELLKQITLLSHLPRSTFPSARAPASHLFTLSFSLLLCELSSHHGLIPSIPGCTAHHYAHLHFASVSLFNFDE